MPTYQFEAMDSSGKEIKDVIDALNEEEAQATIRQPIVPRYPYLCGVPNLRGRFPR